MNSHRWLFRRDKHSDKVWSLAADIGQIQLKVLCWGFVQLSVSPLHSDREDQRATECSHKPSLHFVSFAKPTWKDSWSVWPGLPPQEESAVKRHSPSLQDSTHRSYWSTSRTGPLHSGQWHTGSYLQLWHHWRERWSTREETGTRILQWGKTYARSFVLVLPTGARAPRSLSEVRLIPYLPRKLL